MTTTLTGGGLFFHLTHEQPALAALVADRIYPRRMPGDAVFPLIVYRRIDTQRLTSHSGSSGLASPRIQFDIWARDPDAADAVAEALRKALDGYRGVMGDVPVGAVRIVNDLDGDEADSGLYRRILDAIVTHTEAVA